MDISSPPLLDIFIEDLPVHTNISCPSLSVVPSTSDRGGGIRRQRPGTSESGKGLGPSGDQIGQSKGGVTQRGNRGRYTTLLLSFAIWTTPLTSIRGGVLDRTIGYSVPSPAVIRGLRPVIY